MDEKLNEPTTVEITAAALPDGKVANNVLVWDGTTWIDTPIKNYTSVSPQELKAASVLFNPETYDIPLDGGLLYKKPGNPKLYWYSDGVESDLITAMTMFSDATFELYHLNDITKTLNFNLDNIPVGTTFITVSNKSSLLPANVGTSMALGSVTYGDLGTGNVFIGANTASNIGAGTDNTIIGKQSFNANTTGSNNVSVGSNTMSSNTTGSNNIAVGSNSLTSNNTGTDNIALGRNALYSNTTGSYNTASGSFSLNANTTGNYNTAIGYYSLLNNTTGYSNNASGNNSLNANTTGHDNTACGSNALLSNTTGNFNTASGSLALSSNTTGTNNTASGYNSLSGNTTGSSNTASGYNSLSNNTIGTNNTSIGANSLYANTTGVGNTATGSNTLNANTTGNYNTACGTGSLNANTTGVYNTATGGFSLYSNTTGANNTATGYNSLYANTTGNYNTASGSSSLSSNTTGSSNTASGYNSLSSNTIGFNNSAFGNNSLKSNTTGSGNTAIGYTSLYSNTTGNLNTATGYNSLYANTTGNYNTATGYTSLFFNSTGSSNTATGYNSLYSNTTGSSNTANGSNSLYANTTGANNTANGSSSLYANTTGGNNTASGNASLNANTIGSNNSAFGANALTSNISGSFNTASGYNSLYSNTTGSFNTASGNASLYSNTTGTNNTSIGANSLYANTTGVGNTATGSNTLYSNTTGSDNTATGKNSLYSNTTGANNTATGNYALISNTTGSSNTATGFNSLNANTTGDYNTALGFCSLYSNTTSSNNTATGYASLYYNSTGSYNTATGNNSLYSNTTGANNTATGYIALATNTTGTNNTAYGSRSLYSNASGNDNTALGFSSLASNKSSNNVAVGVSALEFVDNGTQNVAIGWKAGQSLLGSNNIIIGGNSAITGALGNNRLILGTGATALGSNTTVIHPSYIRDNGGVAETGQCRLAYVPGTGELVFDSTDSSPNAGINNVNTLRAPSGSATAPSFSFSADTNTGIYNSLADTLDFTTGGVNRLSITTANVISTVPYLTSAGSATAPSFSFSADTNTGIYNSLADTLDFTTGGVNRLSISTANVISTVPYLTSAGSATAPSFSFSGDTNTGIYRVNTDTMALVCGGIETLTLNTNNATANKLLFLQDGIVTTPSLAFASDTSTGFYRSAASTINFATAGTSRLALNTSSLTSTLPILTSSGSALFPSYSFSADTNTGIYTSAADTINFATNATNRLSINNASLTSTLPILTPSGSALLPSYSFSNDSSTGMYLASNNNIGFACGNILRYLLGSTINQFYNPIGIYNGAGNGAYLMINAGANSYRSAHNGASTNQALQIGSVTGTSSAYLGVDHNNGYSDLGLNFNLVNSGSQTIRTAFIIGNSSTYSSTTAGSETGNMRFYVKPSASSAVEAMRLKNSTTTDAAAYFPSGTAAAPGISFMSNSSTGIYTISGQIAFSVAGTTPLVLNGTYVIPNVDLGASLGLSNYRWTVVYAQNGTIQTSDANLKTNVEPTPLGLDFINRLNPIRYKWAEVKDQDGKTIQSAGTRYHYGLIAQEVKTVLDDIKVNTQDAAFFIDSSITEDPTKPARYGLNYTELICPIIKSIKELKAADISYSADIVTLKANINTCLQNIESRLSRIESLALINLNHLPAVGSV